MENPFEHLLFGDYIACLVGIIILIVRAFKLGSDKFQDKTEYFNNRRFLKKNLWDFILYFFCGFGVLIVIGEIYSNNPDWFASVGLKPGGTYKYLLSLLSGLLGSVIVAALLSFHRK